MNRTPFFSVIVPVYNTPLQDLEECLNSIRAADATFEVLLMDDGSSRETADYLDTYADAHPSFAVRHLSHGGVSRARNRGLSMAAGTYVCFLDSDDCFTDGALDSVKKLLQSGNEPDLLLARITRGSAAPSKIPGNSGRSFMSSITERDLTGRLRRYYLRLKDPAFRNDDAWISRGPHGRFVKQETARKTCFDEAVSYGEDVLWNFMLLRHAGTILVSELCVYWYREAEYSVTQRFRPQFPAELDDLLRRYGRECRDWPEEDRSLLDAAAVEYFTILMRLYVLPGGGSVSYRRYRSVTAKRKWNTVFRRVRLKELYGRYFLTAFLWKAGQKNLLYLVFRIHFERKQLP